MELAILDNLIKDLYQNTIEINKLKRNEEILTDLIFTSNLLVESYEVSKLVLNKMHVFYTLNLYNNGCFKYHFKNNYNVETSLFYMLMYQLERFIEIIYD